MWRKYRSTNTAALKNNHIFVALYVFENYCCVATEFFSGNAIWKKYR